MFILTKERGLKWNPSKLSELLKALVQYCAEYPWACCMNRKDLLCYSVSLAS